MDLARVRERLKEKLRACVQTGRITLSSGKVTDFYFDGRQVSLEPEGSVLIATLVLEELLKRRVESVGGLTSGADPIVSAVGVLAWQRGVPLRLFYVRKEAKGHGMRRRVEGPPLVAGGASGPASGGQPLRVALVDDVLTTGGSILTAREAVVEEAGVEPVLACVVVDREEEGGREKLEAQGMEVAALFRKSELL